MFAIVSPPAPVAVAPVEPVRSKKQLRKQRQRALADIDPPPEQIAALCAELRSEWSEDEHRRRAFITPDMDHNDREELFHSLRKWRPRRVRCRVA